jgi:hypothetical protein
MKIISWRRDRQLMWIKVVGAAISENSK